MQDHESPEAVAARASQKDPIVMYAIVRETLNMSTGKIAAQCMHAAQMLTLKYFEMKDTSSLIQRQMKEAPQSRDFLLSEYVKLSTPISTFGEWLNSSFRKVVLRADDKEWNKVKAEFKDSMVLVVDAGLTEIPSGSETVIGLWPMLKSQAPKIIKRLQALK